MPIAPRAAPRHRSYRPPARRDPARRCPSNASWPRTVERPSLASMSSKVTARSAMAMREVKLQRQRLAAVRRCRHGATGANRPSPPPVSMSRCRPLSSEMRPRPALCADSPSALSRRSTVRSRSAGPATNNLSWPAPLPAATIRSRPSMADQRRAVRRIDRAVEADVGRGRLLPNRRSRARASRRSSRRRRR